MGCSTPVGKAGRPRLLVPLHRALARQHCSTAAERQLVNNNRHQVEFITTAASASSARSPAAAPPSARCWRACTTAASKRPAGHPPAPPHTAAQQLGHLPRTPAAPSPSTLSLSHPFSGLRFCMRNPSFDNATLLLITWAAPPTLIGVHCVAHPGGPAPLPLRALQHHVLLLRLLRGAQPRHHCSNSRRRRRMGDINRRSSSGSSCDSSSKSLERRLTAGCSGQRCRGGVPWGWAARPTRLLAPA